MLGQLRDAIGKRTVASSCDAAADEIFRRRKNVREESRTNGPSLAEIRERAFEIHIERGGIHGCDLDDWLQAERELQEKNNKSKDGGPKKK